MQSYPRKSTVTGSAAQTTRPLVPRATPRTNLAVPTGDSEARRQSGVSALGLGFMSGSLDDSDDEEEDEKPRAAVLPSRDAHRSPPPPEHPQPNQAPIPIAAPRPGHAATPQVLAMPVPTAPQQSAVPAGRLRAPPSAIAIPTGPPPQYRSPTGMSPPGMPSSPSPHPLKAPLTPITPVFARPSFSPEKGEKTSSLAFTPVPIMRSGSEDALLPGRGERGDDFWRRFSMVVREESKKKPSEKQSPWLKKTQSGSTRMSRWVWLIAIIILLAIGGAIGLGLYATHNSPHTAPDALGGSGNYTSGNGTSSMVPSSSFLSSGTPTLPAGTASPHVSPTHTVQRREPIPSGHARRNQHGINRISE